MLQLLIKIIPPSAFMKALAINVCTFSLIEWLWGNRQDPVPHTVLPTLSISICMYLGTYLPNQAAARLRR